MKFLEGFLIKLFTFSKKLKKVLFISALTLQYGFCRYIWFVQLDLTDELKCLQNGQNPKKSIFKKIFENYFLIHKNDLGGPKLLGTNDIRAKSGLIWPLETVDIPKIPKIPHFWRILV